MTKHIAVIGMGYWGKNLVRNFFQIGALHSVCDNNYDVEKAIASQYRGVNFTTDYGRILSDDSIRAVVVATPAETHHRIVREALKVGKDVFVEKPLALEVQEGEQLVQAAKENGRILMVGHILQYHPAIIKLKQLVTNGELGRIQYLYSTRVNMGKIRIEENILWSFAPHDISVMLGILNEEPCQITCQGADYLSDGIADVTMSQFVFPSGVHAHIFVSWLHPLKEQKLVVIGTEKMAVFDDTATNKLIVYPHRIEWKNRIPTAVKAEGEVIPLEMVEPLYAECQHFIKCIEERSKPVTDGDEGVRVLKILEECQRSLEHGKESISHARKKSEKKYFVHETAVIDEPCEIGDGTKIWHYSHIQKGAKIGERCIIGQNCNIANDVVIGNNVKVQNNVSLYTGAVIEDDVFLGPSCVLTNVTNPRSQINRHSLYEKTTIRRGATIGANATIICGIELGRYCFIGAGAVVSKSTPDYGLMIGNPARQIGWMSRHGHRLAHPDSDGVMVCPESGYRYREIASGILRCIDLDEEEALPPDKAIGLKNYDEFK